MRQLDLFGSLFDPPPVEKQEAEKPVVKKEEEKRIIVKETEETVKTYYSIVEVAEDFKEFDEFETGKQKLDKKITPPVENDANSTPSNPTSTRIEQTLQNKRESAPVEPIVEDLNLVQKSEKPVETSLDKLVKVNVNGTDIEDAELISPKSIQAIKEPVISVPDIKIVENKKTSRKTTKVKAPELESNGAVVFTDGKITVKIKNKNPFNNPIEEEEKPIKKEKEKKVPQKRGRKSFKEIDAEVDLIEIPDDETLFQKQYYTISEVAKWFRVNTSLLRFWENEFDVLKPRKNRKGDRLFRPEDVKNLELIYQLLRQRKYTVEGAKEYIKSNKKKADLQLQLTNTLQKFKNFLLDIRSNLQI